MKNETVMSDIRTLLTDITRSSSADYSRAKAYDALRLMDRKGMPDQRSITDQLITAVAVVNAAGLYDAADWIKKNATAQVDKKIAEVGRKCVQTVNRFGYALVGECRGEVFYGTPNFHGTPNVDCGHPSNMAGCAHHEPLYAEPSAPPATVRPSDWCLVSVCGTCGAKCRLKAGHLFSTLHQGEHQPDCIAVHPVAATDAPRANAVKEAIAKSNAALAAGPPFDAGVCGECGAAIIWLEGLPWHAGSASFERTWHEPGVAALADAERKYQSLTETASMRLAQLAAAEKRAKEEAERANSYEFARDLLRESIAALTRKLATIRHAVVDDVLAPMRDEWSNQSIRSFAAAPMPSDMEGWAQQKKMMATALVTVADALAAIDVPTGEEATERLVCSDCSMPYGGDGWLDVTLPDDQWVLIQPRENGGGILCANCIVRRASRLNDVEAVRAVIAFSHGARAHIYLSTACHHGIHSECRQQCKFCGTTCACPCHRADYGAEVIDARIDPDAYAARTDDPVVAATPEPTNAVPMVLYCPNCKRQHVDVDDDTGNWATSRLHRKHLCKPSDGGCGHVWRPFDYATVGVKEVPASPPPFTAEERRRMAATFRDYIIAAESQIAERDAQIDDLEQSNRVLMAACDAMPTNAVPSATTLTFEEWLRHSQFATNEGDDFGVDAAEEAFNARQPEIDALCERERKLREYATHKPECELLHASGMRKRGPCDCGLAELLAAKEDV